MENIQRVSKELTPVLSAVFVAACYGNGTYLAFKADFSAKAIYSKLFLIVKTHLKGPWLYCKIWIAKINCNNQKSKLASKRPVHREFRLTTLGLHTPTTIYYDTKKRKGSKRTNIRVYSAKIKIKSKKKKQNRWWDKVIMYPESSYL